MTQTTKIDLPDGLSRTFSVLGENLGSFFMLIVGWSLLAIAVWYGTQIALVEVLRADAGLAEAYLSWPEEGRLLIGLAPLAIVSTLGTISMVIAWHRRIILGVVPDSPFPTAIGPILGYLGRVIAVFAIPFVPLVLFAAGLALLRDPSSGTAATVAGAAVFSVAAIGGMLLVMRFSLVLPGIAVGDRTMTFSRAWKLSEGNTWRLFWGVFVAALPFTIVQRICEKLLEVERVAESSGAMIILGVGIIAEMLSYATAAGFFSFAYLQLAAAESRSTMPPASHFS